MRTSKSASVTRKTSSRSGTAAKTAATENDQGRKKHRGLGKYGKAISHLEKTSPEQFRQALVSAGIITKAGNLKAKYKRALNDRKRDQEAKMGNALK